MADEKIRTITAYAHKPFALSWQLIINSVLYDLKEKYGREFSADDKEADDILKVLFEKHKQWWEKEPWK
jgi:hypothetical protein